MDFKWGNGISKTFGEVYCYLFNLDKLSKKEYDRLIAIYGIKIVDEIKFYLNECNDNKLFDKLNELYDNYIYVRDKLVTGNIRLVVAASKNYYKDESSFLEILQWGNIGLMKAVEKYDPNFNTRFITIGLDNQLEI